MTQISRPQQGRQVTYPDAGGYTANQWARILRVLATLPTTNAGQGPFYSHYSGLEVTNPAGVTIRVLSGMGLCNGHFLINEDPTNPAGLSNVNFTPTTPGANRTDKVVIVQNNTDNSYDGTPDYGAAVLEFPTVLTDYEGTASIPPHSTRLAILTGVSGGASRVLIQDVAVDGDIFMILLASYTISNAPAILSGPTDQRKFVDAETIQMFVPATGGYIMPVATPTVELTFLPNANILTTGGGLVMPDAVDSYAFGYFICPENYIQDMIVTPVIHAPATADCAVQSYVLYGDWTVNQAYAHSDTVGPNFDAMINNTIGTGTPVNVVNATMTVNEMIQLGMRRNAGLAGDTINDEIRMPGWIVTYFGWKR